MAQQQSPIQNSLGLNIIETLNRIKSQITNNLIFSISCFAAIATSFFNFPKLEYIDFKVIICLFELMIVVDAFDNYNFLQFIATKVCKSCKTERALTWALCLTSFFISMLLTNDVTLFAIVPILIIISRKSNYDIIIPCILVTISANLGSSMTPFGNPQNLFLYSFYQMSIKSFISYSLPVCVLSMILLFGLGFLIKPKEINFEMEHVSIKNKKGMALFAFLSVLIILSVFNVISYLVIFPIVVLVTLLADKRLLKSANYPLILTFVFIFIAVGNVSNIPQLNSSLSNLVRTPKATYVYSLLLSQVISNVPATIVIAPFSSHAQALYYGVNIGGLGTPIASLASIIAYSLYSQEYGENKLKFLLRFTILNLGCLVLLGIIGYFIVA
jgi:Na+/H+ antiporter NhaD/arsenite permease-like protein